jgi:hypothetical protein
MEDLRGHDGGRWWSVGQTSRVLRAARLNVPPTETDLFSKANERIGSTEKQKACFRPENVPCAT